MNYTCKGSLIYDVRIKVENSDSLPIRNHPILAGPLATLGVPNW